MKMNTVLIVLLFSAYNFGGLPDWAVGEGQFDHFYVVSGSGWVKFLTIPFAILLVSQHGFGQ